MALALDRRVDTSSADASCRHYPSARRACLRGQADALRQQALALWHRAHAQFLAGEDPGPWEREACDAETRYRQATAALLVIGGELGESADATQ